MEQVHTSLLLDAFCPLLLWLWLVVIMIVPRTGLRMGGLTSVRVVVTAGSASGEEQPAKQQSGCQQSGGFGELFFVDVHGVHCLDVLKLLDIKGYRGVKIFWISHYACCHPRCSMPGVRLVLSAGSSVGFGWMGDEAFKADRGLVLGDKRIHPFQLEIEQLALHAEHFIEADGAGRVALPAGCPAPVRRAG
jgi:hypothetical protein